MRVVINTVQKKLQRDTIHTKEGSIIVELQAHCFIEEIDRVFQDVLEIVYLIGR